MAEQRDLNRSFTERKDDDKEREEHILKLLHYKGNKNYKIPIHTLWSGSKVLTRL